MLNIKKTQEAFCQPDYSKITNLVTTCSKVSNYFVERKSLNPQTFLLFKLAFEIMNIFVEVFGAKRIMQYLGGLFEELLFFRGSFQELLFISRFRFKGLKSEDGQENTRQDKSQ